MKKNILAFFAMLICVTVTQAQTPGRYTISGGVLGAANYSKFRLEGNTTGFDSKFKWGFAPGVWVNFPLGNILSLEAQAQYSRIGTKIETSGGTTSLDQELSYLSVPVFLKLHTGKIFAITLGGQADFLLKAKNKTGPTTIDNEGDYDHTSIGVTGGFEFFPHGRVTIYGRYMHGLTKLADNSSADPAAYNQQIQAGLKFKLFGHRVSAAMPVPPPPPVITDRDGDGIQDIDDRCPDVAGTAALHGCPDRDGDGITDAEDKCPDVAGLAKYQGCPIPDTDGDGINDEVDKCPTVKGVARYQGCPVPDTDGDGVNDEDDKCPRLAGAANNFGCPVIAQEVIEKVNFAAKNIFFETGSYKLLPKSFKSLDGIATLLTAEPSLMIDISGHTDAQGSDESNQVLSDNRAGAVKNYLVSKGIDAGRLKSSGYGETKPIADNTTVAGRARNRRTEMVVRNY